MGKRDKKQHPSHGMLVCQNQTCREAFPFHKLDMRASLKRPLCPKCWREAQEVKAKQARQRSGI